MARLCLRYISDKEEARDVLIEGFLRVFAMLKRFEYRGENSLERWIRKIMVNECLMNLRKRRRTLFVDVAEEHIAVGNSADGGMDREEIEMLIKILPVGYRTVFNLFAIDGYSHKEISEMLGISESASRSQLTHARARLKEILNNKGWN